MRRRLTSKKDLERKHKRNQWILGVVLVVVMFGSVFGIVVNSFGNDGESTEIEYNGYTFFVEGNYFTLILGESKFYFSNGPDTVDSLRKEVNISKVLPVYAGKTLYLYSEDTEASSELYQNLNPYVSRMQLACESEESCKDDSFPIKTCEDNFILIKESTQNKIYEKENCVYIEGKKEDLTKLADEFLFHILGIKQ